MLSWSMGWIFLRIQTHKLCCLLHQLSERWSLVMKIHLYHLYCWPCDIPERYEYDMILATGKCEPYSIFKFFILVGCYWTNKTTNNSLVGVTMKRLKLLCSTNTKGWLLQVWLLRCKNSKVLFLLVFQAVSFKKCLCSQYQIWQKNKEFITLKISAIPEKMPNVHSLSSRFCATLSGHSKLTHGFTWLPHRRVN